MLVKATAEFPFINHSYREFQNDFLSPTEPDWWMNEKFYHLNWMTVMWLRTEWGRDEKNLLENDIRRT